MKNKSVHITMVVIGILLITKVSGLVRDALAASLFGAGYLSDGFFLALSIVLTLYNLIGKAITLYLIPKFNGTKEDYGLIKAFIFKGTLVTILIVVFYFMFPIKVIGLFYSGDTEAVKALFHNAILASIFVPSIYTLSSYYQSKHKFYLTNLIGLIFNVTIILFIVSNSDMVRFSFFVALFIQFLFLMFFIDKKEIKESKLKKIQIKELFPITIIAVAMAFEQINIMIDRKYISDFSVGELTFLDLGGKVSFMFMGIIVLGITTVIYPKLVDFYKKSDYHKFIILLKKVTVILTVLSVLSILGIMILGEFILKVIFMRGEINSNDILSIFTILPLSIREIMLRFMILREKHITLLLTSIIGLIINIIITANASDAKSVVFGTIIAIVVSTLLLIIPFVKELRLFRESDN